jgi:hypothetical protein
MDGVLGWGCFATLIATVCVAWAGRSWPPALAVAALGTGSTALLWWIGRRPWTAARTLAPPAAAQPVAEVSPGDD